MTPIRRDSSQPMASQRRASATDSPGSGTARKVRSSMAKKAGVFMPKGPTSVELISNSNADTLRPKRSEIKPGPFIRATVADRCDSRPDRWARARLGLLLIQTDHVQPQPIARGKRSFDEARPVIALDGGQIGVGHVGQIRPLDFDRLREMRPAPRLAESCSPTANWLEFSPPPPVDRRTAE